MSSKVVRKKISDAEAAPDACAAPPPARRPVLVDHQADDRAKDSSPDASGDQQTDQSPKKRTLPSHSR